MKYLIEHGADINAESFDGNITFTPLSIAYEKGNETIIKYLIEHGTDIDGKINNGKDSTTYTPLKIAFENGNEIIVEYLTENSVEDECINYLIDHCYDNNDTLLNNACEYVNIFAELYMEINDIDINLIFKKISKRKTKIN